MIPIEKINEKFKACGEMIIRWRWAFITAFVVIFAISVNGLKKIRTDTSKNNWFLEGDTLMLQKDKFEEIFGNSDYGAVLIKTDDVFTTEVLERIRELSKELENDVPYSDEVLSLTDFEYTKGSEWGIEISDLVPERIPENVEELEVIRKKALSKPFVVNRLISEDCRYTWVRLRLKRFPEDWKAKGQEDPDVLVGRTILKIISREKYSILNPVATGMPVINVLKRDFFSEESSKLFIISLIVTVLILAFLLRSFRGVVFPLMVAVGGLIVSFGMQGYLDIRTDPSLYSMPLFLGLAVSIGYSVHVFNHFKRSWLRQGNRKKAVVKAVEETGWPLLFTALTTMAALLSFLVVPVKPLRWIGGTSALLVALSYLIVIILIPCLLSFGKNRKKTVVAEVAHGLIEKKMRLFSRWVARRDKLILVVSALLFLISIYGLTLFEVSFDIKKTFGLKIPYVRDVDYVSNSPIGSYLAYDVGFEFENEGDAKDPDVLRRFDSLVGKINEFPLTKRTSSLLDIVKDMYQVLNEGDSHYYAIPDTKEKLAQTLLLYENAGGAEAEKWVDYEYKRLRVMVEVNSYNSKEAEKELREIRELSLEILPEAKPVLIGTLSQYTVMQNYVSWGQIKSFLLALLVIGLLMMVVFGQIKTGLIALIPNVAPALIVGGLMGYLSIPLDMMTVTIMPMLLGLAVDDTIHFINHAKLNFHRHGRYDISLERVFVVIGKSLFITSLVICLNFSVYLFSIAKIYIHIGFLTGIGIFSALAADFLVTPVLIRKFKVFGKSEEEI